MAPTRFHPPKPVDYSATIWHENLGKRFFEVGEDGKEKYTHLWWGPDRPMTLKAEKRLMLSRLFAKTSRKHGHPVPAFHELEAAVEKLVG